MAKGERDFHEKDVSPKSIANWRSEINNAQGQIMTRTAVVRSVMTDFTLFSFSMSWNLENEQ